MSTSPIILQWCNDVKSPIHPPAIIYQGLGAVELAAAQAKPLQPWKWSKPRLGGWADSMEASGGMGRFTNKRNGI